MSASVRGIGVAVMIRTSGILALLPQQHALPETEPVLFVDDGQTQAVKIDVLGDQCVRAAQQRQISGRKPHEDVAAPSLRHRVRQQLDANADRLA